MLHLLKGWSSHHSRRDSTTREQFDIAVQYGPSLSERFEVDFIAEEAIFPVCSPEYAARLSTPMPLKELARLPLLDVTYDDATWMTWADFFECFDATAAFDEANP